MTRVVVKIAVVGDAGSGKTSLISTTANDTFDARPAPVLPPTRLPAERTPDHVPMIVTDTSSRPEDQQVVDLVLQSADAVVVCFDATRQSTLDSVRTHWYGRIQQLNPGVPVIMACCKADRLEEERDVTILRERVELAVHDLSHVEVCLNCSAKTLRMVNDVFFYALKSVLYPLQPLYDRLEKRLRPLCVRALKRVFIMCDTDGDGALNDVELNNFQLACFGMALDAEELQSVKQIVASKMPAGVSARGITLEGFLFLHVLFIERGRLESTWAVLRKFGYNDQVMLSDEVLDRVSFNQSNDVAWELSDVALDFLIQKFDSVDEDHDRTIGWQQLDTLFSTLPPPVWQGDFWTHLLVPGLSGSAHNLEAFLLKWQVHTLVDPRAAYAYLLYMGYGGPDGAGGPALLARGTRRRTDKRHRAELAARTTIQCLVFGPRGAGKTSLLRALVGMRPEGPPTPAPSAATTTTTAAPSTPPAAATSPASPPPTPVDLYEDPPQVASSPTAAAVAVAVSLQDAGKGTGSQAAWSSVALVKGPDDKERTLVLHEISGELETRLITSAALSAHGATPLIVGRGSGLDPDISLSASLDLARADVAAFVFDSSNPASFREAMDLLVKVSTYAGDSLPCVLVAAKDDLVMSASMESAVASALSDLQLAGCARTSAQLGELNNVFSTLVTAAVNPEGWIPETPARKAHRRLVRQVVAGSIAGVATAGLVYCVYRLLSSSSSPSPAASSATSSSRPAPNSKAANAAATAAAVRATEGFFGSRSAPAPASTSAASSKGGAKGSAAAAEPEWSLSSLLDAISEFFAGLFGETTTATGKAPATGSSKVKAHSVMELPHPVGSCSAAGQQSVADSSSGPSTQSVAGHDRHSSSGVTSTMLRWVGAACAVGLPLATGLLMDA